VIGLNPSIETAHSRALAFERILSAALLALAFGLCCVSPLFSQEHEVSKAELLVGYSYLHSSNTNFNGWKTTLVGNVNHWLGLAADWTVTMPERRANIALRLGLTSSCGRTRD
jgi:hypothetical protein